MSCLVKKTHQLKRAVYDYLIQPYFLVTFFSHSQSYICEVLTWCSCSLTVQCCEILDYSAMRKIILCFIISWMTCMEESCIISCFHGVFQTFSCHFCFTVFCNFLKPGKKELFYSWLTRDQVSHLFSLENVVCVGGPKTKGLLFRNPDCIHLIH